MKLLFPFVLCVLKNDFEQSSHKRDNFESRAKRNLKQNAMSLKSLGSSETKKKAASSLKARFRYQEKSKDTL